MALKFSEFIKTVSDPRISLLRDKNIVKWIYGDLSFLPARKKEYEDAWGRQFITKKQWSGQLGEKISKEACILLYNNVRDPKLINKFKLDLEVDKYIFEVKTQTYLTNGSAAEKIPGVSFKYADVPFISGKILKVLCVAGAEEQSIKYGLLPGPSQSFQKKNYVKFLKENHIEFLGMSEFLKSQVLALKNKTTY